MATLPRSRPRRLILLIMSIALAACSGAPPARNLPAASPAQRDGTPVPAAPLPNALAPGQSDLIFSPAILPLDGPEIANPGRGLYRWRGQTAICPPELKSDRDAYNRWRWADVETAAGAYDWSAIHRFLDEAEARGQQAWIGLGTSAGPDRDGPYLPAFMRQPGWGAEFAGEWYPDYNQPAVRARLEALLDAFAGEFAADPRIAGVQMRSYGRYGEGYLPWDAPKDHPMWASDATAEWLIDAWHTRLRGSYQLMVPLSNNHLFRYAISKTPPWGVTRDALGMPGQMANIDAAMAGDEVIGGVAVGPALRERWKVAPIFTEMIGESGDLDYGQQFSAAATQVISYHVSLVSNGNFAAPYKESPWNFWPAGEDCPAQPSAWTAENVADFALAGKRAGYRYAPFRLAIVAAAGSLKISVAWRNDGVAPIYREWPVRIQLRQGDRTAWEGISQVDLRTVLPGDPAGVNDEFDLPSLAPGTYAIRLFAPSPYPGLAPLAFAIAGRDAEGGYEIADIAIK